MKDKLKVSIVEEVEKMRVIETIKQLPFFDNLPRTVLQEMAQQARVREIAAGQTIYLEGDDATHIYILINGWIKSTRTSVEGREQAMQFLKPVSIFGDIAVLTGHTYPCTVTALDNVEVLTIDKNFFLGLINRHPELSMAIIQQLSDRVMHFIQLAEDLSLRSVEARLANTLLKNAEQVGTQIVVPRRRWTTFDEMAIRLGTVREVLSRALHLLEEEGLLKVERERIIILNQEALTQRGKS